MAERCDERDRVEEFLAISFTNTPLVKRAKTGNDYESLFCEGDDVGQLPLQGKSKTRGS